MITKSLSAATIIHFGLLTSAAVGFLLMTSAPFASLVILYNFSYVIYLICMILSWWFNRSRAFFIVAVLGLSQLALSNFTVSYFDKQFYSNTIYPVICLLIPLNIFIFSRLDERGIFSTWGIKRFGLIIAQIFFIATVALTQDAELIAPVSQSLFPINLAFYTPLPQTAVLAFIAALLYLIKKQSQGKSNLDGAFISTLLAAAIALHLKENPLAAPTFFAASGIMMLIAVMQDSYSMAYLDELTRLPARRALQEELMKLSGSYVIAMVDIDFFKKFNDTYGHDVGDAVLRLVASVMKDITGGGKAFRYGGEEFTVIFPGISIAEAIPHLEQLRQSVSQTGYTPLANSDNKKSAQKQLFVTISIGLAEKSPKYKTPDEVIKVADSALYRAKNKGRNCVSK